MASPLRVLAAATGILALLLLTACAAEDSEPEPDLVAPAFSDEDLGPEDGFVPDGETVALGERVPAIENLDPKLRDALEHAAAAAREHDVLLTFTSAWRSAHYQEVLYDRAVLSYGGEEEASRWVMKPDRSAHVTGHAVDVATVDARDWLARFGAEFGLCQIYANEAWHYEFVEGATTTGCPLQFSDSSARR